MTRAWLGFAAIGVELAGCAIRRWNILAFWGQRREDADPLDVRTTRVFFHYPDEPPEERWADSRNAPNGLDILEGPMLRAAIVPRPVSVVAACSSPTGSTATASQS